MPDNSTTDGTEPLLDAAYESVESIHNDTAIDKSQQQNEKDKPDKVIHSLSDLTFVRLIDPIHIPSYLVEQNKDRYYSTEKFYEYQKICCLTQSNTGPILNPSNLLYAIVHERLRQVKGFAWMTIDFLNNFLIIHAFQMDKEYWNRGDATSLLDQKAKRIIKDLELSRIIWITKTPKFCESKGFKRSKDVVMIYEMNED